MTITVQTQSAFSTLLFLICCVLVLSNCSGLHQGNTPQESKQAFSVEGVRNEVNTIQRQNKAVSTSKFLSIAQFLIESDETELLERLLTSARPDDFGSEEFIRYSVIASTAYLDVGRVLKADSILNSQRLTQLMPTVSVEVKKTIYTLKARVFDRLNQPIQSIEQRVALGKFLSDNLDLIENNELIWQQLSSLTVEQLKQAQNNSADTLLSAWYELAIVSKAYASNVTALGQAINTWRENHATHPARLEMPMDLKYLLSIKALQPQRIALLLPLKGQLAPVGKAIRDGFLAAYYLADIASKPTIFLINTHDKQATEFYAEALESGADLLVGPLEKEKVAQLSQQKNLAITTLALNYLPPLVSESLEEQGPEEKNIASTRESKVRVRESKMNTMPAFYQLGLSPEGEAKQAAERAWIEGHRQVLVLGSFADWSQRAMAIFEETWLLQGGEVVGAHTFSSNSSYALVLKAALGIDESEARAKQLKRITGSKFEFQPRRRRDIDAIFLAAQSNEAQQIKPTLAFYYAGDIPVYATSQVYSSELSSDRRKHDLNGIRFTSLPWHLDTMNAERELIEQFVQVPPGYDRLYALGADAYLLHNRLLHLANSSSVRIPGKTGILSLSENLQIVREQPWGIIVNGNLETLSNDAIESPQDSLPHLLRD